MLSIVLLGMGVSLGEVTIVGFCDLIAPCYEQMFTSGTRGSGLLCSFLYLMLRTLGISNSLIFIILLPLPMLYVGMFIYIYRKKSMLERIVHAKKISNNDSNDKKEVLVESIYHESTELSLQPLKNAIKICIPVFLIGIALASIDSWGMSGYSDRIKEERKQYQVKHDYLEKYFYEICQVIIQLCGCVAAIVIGKKMANHLMKLLIYQVINLGFTMYMVLKSFSMNILILAFAPIFYGIGGGLSFVGTLTWVSKSFKLSEKNKEIASSIMLLLYDVGIAVGLGFVWIFDNYVKPIQH